MESLHRQGGPKKSARRKTDLRELGIARLADICYVSAGHEQDRVAQPMPRVESPPSDKFKDAACVLDDPAHFRERLGRLVKYKPVEKPA